MLLKIRGIEVNCRFAVSIYCDFNGRDISCYLVWNSNLDSEPLSGNLRRG
jgi:hypothetical protein